MHACNLVSCAGPRPDPKEGEKALPICNPYKTKSGSTQVTQDAVFANLTAAIIQHIDTKYPGYIDCTTKPSPTYVKERFVEWMKAYEECIAASGDGDDPDADGPSGSSAAIVTHFSSELQTTLATLYEAKKAADRAVKSYVLSP